MMNGRGAATETHSNPASSVSSCSQIHLIPRQPLGCGMTVAGSTQGPNDDSRRSAGVGIPLYTKVKIFPQTSGDLTGRWDARRFLDTVGFPQVVLQILIRKNLCPGAINMACHDDHVELSKLENLWDYTWDKNWIAPRPRPN